MGRRRPLPALALLTALLTALGVIAAAPAQAAPIDYVALGDSFSSGVGAPGATGSCGRSPQSYAPLWATAHATQTFANATCSGAVTTDVINQVSSLNANTDVVSITIGGNDAGFFSTMITCVLASESSCQAAVNRGINDATLPGKLDRTYAAIRSRAPAATVYVLGYPRLFELPSSCFGQPSLAKRRILNAGADRLSDVIRGRAQAAGFRYVDVRPVFSGHGVCGSPSWVNGSLLSSGAYHPNAAGYRSGYLAAFTAATG